MFYERRAEGSSPVNVLPRLNFASIFSRSEFVCLFVCFPPEVNVLFSLALHYKSLLCETCLNQSYLAVPDRLCGLAPVGLLAVNRGLRVLPSGSCKAAAGVLPGLVFKDSVKTYSLIHPLHLLRHTWWNRRPTSYTLLACQMCCC